MGREFENLRKKLVPLLCCAMVLGGIVWPWHIIKHVPEKESCTANEVMQQEENDEEALEYNDPQEKEEDFYN